jgi:hypothetical protein
VSATAQRGGARERASASPAHRRAEPHEAGRKPARARASPRVGDAGNLAVQRAARASAPPVQAISAQRVQRCVSCHGAPSLAGEEALLQREATGPAPATPVGAQPAGGGQSLDPHTRSFMESRFGRDLGGVRVHTGPAADRAASDVNARAFTLGQDIVFARGEYAPDVPAGRRLLAHELVHTVQQAGAPAPAPQHALRVSEPGDALEREADRVAAQVMIGSATSSPITPAAEGITQRQIPGEYRARALVEQVSETLAPVTESIDYVSSGISDLGSAIADTLGGIISIDGSSLVIDVPSMPVCPTLSFQFTLPEIGADLPIALGVLPIADIVQIYGEVGLHAGLTPEISAQLGPCELHGLRIEIDPLGPTISAAGAITVTAALGLGAEGRIGLFGEVGMLIVWPDPPFIITVPVVRMEAGLAGFARGLAIAEVTAGVAASGGLTGIHWSTHGHLNVGLAADLGAAGYGSLQLLGLDVCTLYWPLWAWHDQMTISGGVDLSLDVGLGGVSVDFSMEEPVIDAVPFASLPLDIPREMFSDDCPLCQVFYDLGLMPSQNGGSWTGHPAPPWGGPLFVYPRDPGIPSGSLCRGACGPNCDTCSPPQERLVCETMPDGRHQYWLYPKYQVCNTHLGCREHDAGYDWCAAGGEVSLWGPCHRLPDFECLCSYGAPQCVGWIGGSPPYDDQMYFSDQPKRLTGCVGPCPEEETTPQGVTRYRLCLPRITLMDRRQLFNRSWSDATRDIELYSRWFVIPVGDIPVPILVEVLARGNANARVGAGIGPIFLSELCLDVDPRHGVYRGTAELHVRAGLNGSLALTGELEGRAGWGCLLNVVSATTGLTGRGHAELNPELIDRVVVSCRNGDIVLDNSVLLNACARLLLGLDANLSLRLFGFSILDEHWTLVERAWDRCWNMQLGVVSLPLGRAKATFDAERLDVTELLRWALGSAADDRHVLGKLLGQAAGAPAGAPAGAAPLAVGSGSAGGEVDDLTIPADPAAASGTTDPCPTPAGGCASGHGGVSGQKVADSNIFMDRVEGGLPQRQRVDCNYLQNPAVSLHVPTVAEEEALAVDPHGTQAKRLAGFPGGAAIIKTADGDISIIPDLSKVISKKFGVNDLKIALRASELTLPLATCQANMENQLKDSNFPERVKLLGHVVVEVP